MTLAIETTALTKRFGSLTAVDGLDLAVECGEVFGFLGPNGAGKTTTIRMLLGILRPTSGTARVLGGAGTDPETRRRVAFLPAELQFDPRHTVAEVLDFLGALRGGFDSQLVGTLLERFDLDPTRPVGQLSTGNRRKLGVIQAFAGRADLLLLDEPSSGLDPILQHEFLALVEEAVADGATVFLSSHALAEVERVAGRVAILRRGALVALGTVDELRTRSRQRVELHLTSERAARSFTGVDGVLEAIVRGRVVSLVVEGTLDAVVKHAAKHTVERVVAGEGELEDTFLDLYRQEAV